MYDSVPDRLEYRGCLDSKQKAEHYTSPTHIEKEEAFNDGVQVSQVGQVCNATLEPIECPSYIGMMAIPIAAGIIIKPIIGATFAMEMNWRWIGWLNMPIVGPSAALAITFLNLKPIKPPLRARFLQLDFIGMSLFIAGGTAFAVPLGLGGPVDPWSLGKISLPLIIGIVLLLAVAVYEGNSRFQISP